MNYIQNEYSKLNKNDNYELLSVYYKEGEASEEEEEKIILRYIS